VDVVAAAGSSPGWPSDVEVFVVAAVSFWFAGLALFSLVLCEGRRSFGEFPRGRRRSGLRLSNPIVVSGRSDSAR